MSEVDQAGLTVKQFLNESLYNPTYYIETCFRISLTNQQKQLADTFVKLLLDRYYKDLLNKNKITEESIPEFVKGFETVDKWGMSVSSGRGTGKSTFISLITLWLCHCWKNMKLLIVLPSEQQIKDIIISEINLWLHKTDEQGRFIYPFKDLVVLSQEGLYFNGNNTSRVSFKPVGKNLSIEQLKSSLSGRHSFMNITIMDESISYDETVIKTFLSSATDEVAFICMFGNPVEHSYFVNCVFDPQISRNWIPIILDYEKSDRASPDAIKRLQNELGAESPEYFANVKGIFVTSSAEKLFNDNWTLACIKSRKPPENKVISCGFDPAGQGDDISVVALFHDLHLMEFEVIEGKDSMEKTYNLCQYISDNNIQVCGIDCVGPGQNIYEEAKKILPSVVFRNLKNSNTSNRPDKFLNSRAESMWELREMLESNRISFEPQKDIKKASYFQQFRRELSVVQYEKKNQKITIMSKVKLRSKLGGKSTDFLDAVLNAIYRNQYIRPDFLKMKIEPSIDRKLFQERYKEPETNHWMEF